MPNITTCLWFDGDAEEAATFYTSVFPNSRIDKVVRAATDTPSNRTGQDQAEVDRYWDALIAGGGEPSVCGWLKDRFGLSWQVVPRRLNEMMESDDRAAAERATKAMLEMTKLDVAKLEEAYRGQPALTR